MTKLLIEKTVHPRTRETVWKVRAWYGEQCWYAAQLKSLPSAIKLASEWVEEDALHNQQGGAE